MSQAEYKELADKDFITRIVIEQAQHTEGGISWCVFQRLIDKVKQRIDLAETQDEGAAGEHGPKCWGKTSISDEMMYCYCGSTDLRPQPSGETRAALDRLKMAAHVYEDDEMAADCATLEALLSARPLALGGQHSGGEWRCEDCGAQADEWFDCCKNPARAEAQDEGAAGELKPCPFCGGPAKMIETMGEWVGKGKGVDGGAYGPPNHRVVCAALYESPIRPCSGRASPSTEQKAIAAWNARAHPSPTPAADADRVQIAVKALENIKHAANDGWGVRVRIYIEQLASETLAALKSND